MTPISIDFISFFHAGLWREISPVNLHSSASLKLEFPQNACPHLARHQLI